MQDHEDVGVVVPVDGLGRRSSSALAAFSAVHGGLWRMAYEPRSALGLAAVLGYGAARP